MFLILFVDQVNVIWSKLNEKSRPKLLSVGLQQITFDMRYRIRMKECNNTANNQTIIQNWQLEIRKVAYEDFGVYQCSLPLVKPQYKNITLQVIRMLTFFFSPFFVTLFNKLVYKI